MAEKITSGPDEGYYTLPSSLSREQVRPDIEIGEPELYQAYRAWQLGLEQSAGESQVYHRYSPGPGKQIRGFNRDYLPYVDGLHYVRRSPQINLRQQLFALENKLIPFTGNTEVFNTQLRKVAVPDDWCPHLLDPCPASAAGDWCRRCKMRTARPPTLFTLGPLAVLARWLTLGLFCMVISSTIMLAIRSR